MSEGGKGGGGGGGGGGAGGGDFGRDEMNQLLGGGLSERLLAPRGAASVLPPIAKRGGSAASKKGKDVADMTAAEAAAYLLEKQAHKKGASAAAAAGHEHSHARQRHRATKVRQYHKLLAEQIADFGGRPAMLNLAIAQVSSRTGLGMSRPLS